MSTHTIPSVSFFEFLKESPSILKNPLPFHQKNFTKHGDTFSIRLGFGKSCIFTRDEKLIKHILQNHSKYYYKSPLQTHELAKYIGNGLLTSNGSYWKQQRKLIQPAFYKQALNQIQFTIIDTILENIENFIPDQSLDIFPIFNHLAFDVVGRSLFSFQDRETFTRIEVITESIQRSLIKEIRQPYKKPLFYLNRHFYNTQKLAQEARDLLKKIIQQRQTEPKSENHDLLDMLLASTYEGGTSMTMEQLIDEILILFVAGHETTSNALSFTLLLLAQHPEYQIQIFEEVKNLDPKQMDMRQYFESCPMTKKCIDEAMRLYPPAYFFDRISIENDQYDTYTFKKGTMILMSLYEVHRKQSLWKKADQFDPNRFDHIPKKQLSEQFFPFGAGSRMCVGSNFAYYEMLVTIAEMVKKFKLSAEKKDIEFQPLVTLKPKNATIHFSLR